MSRSYNLFACIFFITTFLSCQQQERKVVYNIQEMPTVPLKGELIEEELLTPYTKQMEYIQSSLFHFTPQHQEVCLVTNEKADTIGNLCSVGNGPGEIINWAYYTGISSKQDTIYIFDTSSKRVNTYQLKISSENVQYTLLGSSKIHEKKTPKGMISSAIFKLKRLDNGYYIGLRMLNSSTLFTLFDKDLNEVCRFGDYPIDKGLSGGETRLTAYFDGHLEVKGNSLYYGVNRFAYMVRYDVDKNGNVTKVWENMYAKVLCRTENNNLRFYGDNVEGFYSFTIGKKYIYASYSGIKSGEMHKQRSAQALYPKTLLILDLNGKPLAKFSVDKCFVPLCLDDKEEYLYVQHDEPDTSLWRYKVADILRHL